MTYLVPLLDGPADGVEIGRRRIEAADENVVGKPVIGGPAEIVGGDLRLIGIEMGNLPLA